MDSLSVGTLVERPSIRKVQTGKALALCQHDPVRPNIPYWWRCRDPFTEMYEYRNDNPNGKPLAVVCVAYCQYVPKSEYDLLFQAKPGKNAIFYTVWSNQKGMGRQIIKDVLVPASEKAERFVTLSPKTEMAKTFHLRNGAVLLRENTTTYNFEYYVKPSK